ncbi:isopentenyl-diphosphate Delta-isomerase [Thermobifida cellulosilytica]|jgi:isopentenyl-diphosphate delta-isomerase, type 1|uniref:Isopentenyl-diphosphate Delta-isomerase n=1 Tax=Thermobifida cellulosilytica TB100 TaxID=665004 RepID=A0A147KIN1_THECS|nr:isopentenyl-diphosphate Delta-isomerase [Thermobifida cellulosilytica]KUP97147.1 isopentenyl-diphosphate delta-isomerase [Thermobifida cellulosilytica TB100]
MSSPVDTAGREEVVLLDERHRPIGAAAKSGVHHESTPLHLAFSCYIFDSRSRLLVTRRALGKQTWPGVWTNSCCGHPGPGEPVAEAVHRRVREELGLHVTGLRLALPEFRYRAVDASGVVENEVCPVYVASADDDPRPDPAEVMDWQWVDWQTFVAMARNAPWSISPWAAEQAVLLDEKQM